ncbi:MAG TPA: hypothetical protein VFT98_12565 [Myxococcota bacterium]|nr:hypothetical protein [Myxococcota bacterium]
MASQADDAEGAQYSRATKDIRDTVKWLIAAFAQLGAALALGTSLSDVDDLAFASTSWLAATLGLGGAIVALLASIRSAIDVLRPAEVFASSLRAANQEKEIADVCGDVDAHREDFLPPGHANVAYFFTQYGVAEKRSRANPKGDADFQALDAWLGRILDYAAFQLVYRRFQRCLDTLHWAIPVALVSVVAFVWAVSSPEPQEKAPIAHVVLEQRLVSGAPPPATSVRFAPGSCELLTGEPAFAAAAQALESTSDAALLVVGRRASSASSDRDLFARRTETIRRRLASIRGHDRATIFPVEIVRSENASGRGPSQPADVDELVLLVTSAID